ncbi:hypothetical protein PSEUDO8O_30744 [Pseudomonas sp. 8O]|nr:hypothetical protein PSEUDO8O_30744 [Pseudomonas sp. 8O]
MRNGDCNRIGVLELARILSWLFWHFKQNLNQKF